MIKKFSTILFVLISSGVIAETESPYVGQATQSVKALSQNEIENYSNGKGMGLAKAAELNHFPGPSHVLALASELNLSESQLEETNQIFENMNSEARFLGLEIIAKEKEIDSAFALKAIKSELLALLLAEVGTFQTKLRFVHLNAHLQQHLILTDGQIEQYDLLRGYRSDSIELQNNSHHR